MQTIDLDLLRELADITDRPCISIYMPTHSVHPANAIDPQTFKKLYKKAAQYIQDHQLTAYEDILSSIATLSGDKTFWDNSTAGLAILLSDNLVKILRLPDTVAEIVCVARSFCLKPLFKLAHDNQQYYILALNLDHVALYKGDKYSLEELDIQGKIPTSMKEALGDELTDNHLHGSVVEGAGLHGYMEKSQEQDIDMDRFFRAVDQALPAVAEFTADIPLILAALPEHHTHFKRISKCQFIAPLHIQANPKALDKDGLLSKVQELLTQTSKTDNEAVFERQQVASAEQRSSTDISDIIRDAIDGKIDTLCFAEDAFFDGQVDMDNRTIDTTENKLKTDLLNEIACITFNNGGKVMIVDKATMPIESTIFTINRY